MLSITDFWGVRQPLSEVDFIFCCRPARLDLSRKARRAWGAVGGRGELDVVFKAVKESRLRYKKKRDRSEIALA
jgi:hypothetical protein